MSQVPPGSAGPSGPGPVGPRRPQSVTLRDDARQGDDLGSLMNPAQQSLSDALRVCYRLVQFTILVLIVVYLFSSFQTVNQGERALRLAFGRVEGDDLAPGPQFALPTPIGELVKIPVGTTTLRLDQEFWPALRDENKNKTPQELKNVGKGALDPVSDGSLLTADGNLTLARFSVTYRREKFRAYAQTVRPEDEERIVRGAVRRGVVHATAAVTIDEFLKNVADEDRKGTFVSVSNRARQIAQRTLEDMGTGLIIDDLSIQSPTPPFELIGKFETVQSSQSKAKERSEQAQSERVRTLAEAAGDGAEPLLAEIAAYGAFLDRGDAAAADAQLKKIDGMFVSLKAPRADGSTAEISGRAARALSSAREYRSSVVSRAESDARTFEVKRGTYKANPSLLVSGEWIDSYTKFLSRDSVEQVWLPPGVRTVQLELNRDPEKARRAEVARNKSEAEARNLKEIEKQDKGRFQDAAKPTTVRE